MELRYRQIRVGTIIDEFLSDGAWFGRFNESMALDANPLHQRLHEYIAFSVQWHERLRSNLPAEANEFDQFGELISSGAWQTLASDGSIALIADAPVFVEDEVTWTTIPPAL